MSCQRWLKERFKIAQEFEIESKSKQKTNEENRKVKSKLNGFGGWLILTKAFKQMTVLIGKADVKDYS